MNLLINPLRKFQTIVFLAILVVGGIQSALAQQARAPVVVVIDFQRAILSSKAAKSLTEEIGKLTKSYQIEIAKQEDALRAAQRELQLEADKLTPEQLQKKQEALNALVAKYQADFQQKKKRLEAIDQQGSQAIRNTLIEVSQNLAKQRGYNLILDKGVVIFSLDSLDITDEIIKLLDQKLHVVKINIPN